MRTRKIIYILMLSLVIIGCKKDDENNNDDDYILQLPVDSYVEGYIQKGPFISGTSLKIQELDDNLNSTGVVHEVIIDNDLGNYNIAPTIGTRYVEIIASGKYYNESTGLISSSELTLRSIVKTDKNIYANINILTTISKKRIMYLMKNSGLTFSKAQAQAESELLSQFGITENNLDNFNTMDITQNNMSGAIVLAVSSILQNNTNPTLLNQIATSFGTDLETDGEFGPYNQELILEKSKFIKTTAIRNNLTERYSELGLNVTIPNFEVYTEMLLGIDVTSNLLAYYPCDENMNDVSGNENNAVGVNLTQTNDINGERNKAFSLVNGSYIQYPLPLDIENEPEWTYSLWFNVSNPNDYIQVLLGLDNSSGYGWPYDIPFYFGSNSNVLFSYDGGSHEIGGQISLNTWYHAVLVCLENKAQFYVNGEELLTVDYVDYDTDGETINNYYFSGSTYDDRDAYFDGKVDEIRFFKRALNRKEVNKLYNDFLD